MVSCKHVPVASIVATFFVILGDAILVSFKIIQNSNSAYFNDNITKNVNKFSDGVVFFVFLNLITLTLTIIVILTTFAGCIETDNEFLSKLRGEKPCLALLIIVILFSLFWSVIGSVMFSQLTLSNTIEKECKSYKYYLEKKSNDSLCISLIDVQDPSKRRLCDSNRIKAYCDVYSIDVADAVILGVIGVAFVNSGLFIYVICLSLNLVLIRVESTMDLESIAQCRY